MNSITVTTLSGETSIITVNQGQQGPAGVGIAVDNYADNRVLTSDGTVGGAHAESNLEFDGSQLTISGVPVSVSGHTHTSSNISDFNSSVSGLLPVKNIIAGSGVSVTSLNGAYTVSASGGGGATISNYADNRVLTSDGTATGINGESNLTFDGSTLLVNGTSVSVSGHTHTSSNISDFNSSVSGLLPSVSGTGYATSSFVNNVYVISVTGLQPTGNYSIVGHTHISSDITDFNSSVSGLLPIISNTANNRLLTSTGTNTGINAEDNLTFDGSLLTVTGSGSFVSGIRVGDAAITGIITGLSTTSTVPSIRFQSITSNHSNTSHVIFDWYKNLSTRLFYIDGAGNFYADSSNGNFIASNAAPSSSNGSYIGHGMRRHGSTSGFDFAWGESITSTTEPGIDLFPIGGTHIASGILLRLSKNSAKTDVAMIVNGSGNVGLGTNNPGYNLDVYPTTSSATLRVGSHTIVENVVSDQSMFARNVVFNDVTGWKNINTDYSTAIRMNNDFGDGSIAFHLHGSESAGTNISSPWDSTDIKMVIRNGGNVGIGTTNPSYTLDVNGGAQFTQIYPSVGSGSIISNAVDTDVSTAQIFDILLTDNITLNNPTNGIDGVTIRWRLKQDSTGSRTVTLGANFVIPSSASNPLPFSTAANAVDILAATYYAPDDKWHIVAFVPGY